MSQYQTDSKLVISSQLVQHGKLYQISTLLVCLQYLSESFIYAKELNLVYVVSKTCDFRRY